MNLKRTYWLLYEGKHIDSYFNVSQHLPSGNVSGNQYMVRKEDERVTYIHGTIEIDSSNLHLWKRVKRPTWSLLGE